MTMDDYPNRAVLSQMAKAEALLFTRLGQKSPMSEEEAETWKQENAESIRLYNERTEKNGVFSDGLRTF